MFRIVVFIDNTDRCSLPETLQMLESIKVILGMNGFYLHSWVTAEGRIIDSLLMISGIAIIGVWISTLGAGLVESRMKKCK